MPFRLRTFAFLGLFVALAIIFGFWIYTTAIQRAAQGEFPVGDSGMLILLILWWWSPESVLFRRAAPFDRVGITGAAVEPEGGSDAKGRGTLKERMVWTIASFVGWVLLEWQADTAAHAAFLDPTRQNLTSYGARSLAFIVFIFLWIVAFPIFDLPQSDVQTTTSSPRHAKYLWQLTVVVLGIVIGAFGLWRAQLLLHAPELSGMQKFNVIQTWLVRVFLVSYIALIARCFLPGLSSFLASIVRKPPAASAGKKLKWCR